MGVFLMAHGDEAPSAWVKRWAHLIAPQGRVLDVACGRGRHMRLLAGLGHTPLGIDRDAQALATLADLAPHGETLLADIENQPWPLPHQQFDGVIVTHYLWRPLMPHILDSLAPEGVLIYETFAAGNETVGKPSRPDFLLQPGELLRICQHLHIVAFEDGFQSQPDRFVQRIVAVRATQSTPAVRRFHL